MVNRFTGGVLSRTRHPALLFALLLIVALEAGWTAAGYLTFGDRVATSVTFSALRETVPGGIRSYGVLAAATAVTLLLGLFADRLEALRLGCLFAMCHHGTLTTFAVVSWVKTAQIGAWGAPGKTLAMATVALLCLRHLPGAARRA